MGYGTFEAKFIPLSLVSNITKIYILRKDKGPEIEKVEYINLPGICKLKLINFFITPLLLAYYAKNKNAKLILSYHAVPHAFFAYIASMITGIPFNISQTGLFIQKYSQKPIIGRIIKQIFKKAAFINVPGNMSKEFWITQGIKSNRINILHSTIDSQYFISDEQKAEYDFIILSRLAPEKNIELIIEAFELLFKKGYNPRMVVVGSGKMKMKLENLVKSKNISSNVDFVGFKKDTKFWFNKSNIFVMSSLSEGLPTSLMQAMSCKLISISSNVGNISDMIINNETGFLFESKNLKELTKIMEYTFLNFQQLSVIGDNARNIIIENHSFNNAVKLWNEQIAKFGV